MQDEADAAAAAYQQAVAEAGLDRDAFFSDAFLPSGDDDQPSTP